ncbi:MAG: hypothetical protein ACR2G6_16095 [Gemmatimonadaceae bacterium]
MAAGTDSLCAGIWLAAGVVVRGSGKLCVRDGGGGAGEAGAVGEASKCAGVAKAGERIEAAGPAGVAARAAVGGM